MGDGGCGMSVQDSRASNLELIQQPSPTNDESGVRLGTVAQETLGRQRVSWRTWRQLSRTNDENVPKKLVLRRTRANVGKGGKEKTRKINGKKMKRELC